jgi:hypothetical protein
MRKIMNYTLAFLLGTSPLTTNIGSNSNEGNLEKKMVRWSLSENPKLREDVIGWDTAQIKNYKIPVAKTNYKLNPHQCSAYAQMVAKNEYGKEFYWRDSWDRIYWDNVIEKFDKKDQEKNWNKIVESAKSNKLEPGMIVGFYYEGSAYTHKKDEKGNPKIATHTAIYRGTQLNKNGKVELVFDHQWGNRQERITSEGNWVQEMEKKLYPTYIVDAPDELNGDLASNN